MKIYSIITAIVISVISLPSCNPKGDLPESCSSSIDIMSIDNSKISQSLKDKIFKPVSGGRYIAKSSSKFNTNGKTITIPVSFVGLPRNTSVTDLRIRSEFFESGGFGNDNINTYFEANSYGQFKLTNLCISPTVSLNNDTAYYAAGGVNRDWTRNPQLTQEICQNAQVNWKAIDLNNDQKITSDEAQINILYSDGGLGANRPNEFSINTNWGTYLITNSFCFLSCKSNTQADKEVDPIAYNYVTIRHELMHAFFNLPDRYNPSLGKTGEYDPMSANRPRWTNMNIIDKIKIGWVTPKIFTFDQDINPLAAVNGKNYSFPNSARYPAAVVLYNSKFPDECWVVENRCKDCNPIAKFDSGIESKLKPDFDSGLSESGLAVWWLDLKTEKVILISASKPSLKPEQYDDFPQTGALYSFIDKTKAKEKIPLISADGFAAFFFRNVSVPGLSVCAEL